MSNSNSKQSNARSVSARNHVARVFHACIFLGIRPAGYYRSKAIPLRNNRGGTDAFIAHEMKFARAKLSGAMIAELRRRGVPSGTQITMDWERFVVDAGYRRQKLVGTGAHAEKAVEITKLLANDIEKSFEQYNTEAKAFIDKVNASKLGKKTKYTFVS